MHVNPILNTMISACLFFWGMNWQASPPSSHSGSRFDHPDACKKKHGVPGNNTPNHPILCNIWRCPKIGIPQNGWLIMEDLIKLDDLGYPPSKEIPILKAMIVGLRKEKKQHGITAIRMSTNMTSTTRAGVQTAAHMFLVRESTCFGFLLSLVGHVLRHSRCLMESVFDSIGAAILITNQRDAMNKIKFHTTS